MNTATPAVRATRARTKATVLVVGLLAAAGATATASADDVQSASTPEKTPMVETPFVATPALEVAGVTTPAQAADATVEPIELPASISLGLTGIVDQDVESPESTPPVAVAPAVPAVTVLDAQTVDSIEVESIPVQADLPAGAAIDGTDGHVWTASGLPTTVRVDTSDDGAQIEAGPAAASVGLDL